jgi:hypothetical protein
MIANMFEALKGINDSENIYRAGENMKENIITSSTQSRSA